jgi:hypothetical protein
VPSPSKLRVPLLAVLAVLAISAVWVSKGPLQDVHWDAPIYLARGKMAADTPYLRNLAAHAREIADSLSRYQLGEDTEYWDFMRLGNTMLLALVISVAGAGMPGIYAAFWLYTGLLAAALVFGVLLSRKIIDVLDGQLPQRATAKGAVLSGLLYAASDVYRHLSGNLVSEIPAMFLLTTSAYALVMASSSRRVSLAVLSGLLGFLLYVVKMEAVWAYASFAVLYVTILWRKAPEKLWWPAFLTSALIAGLLFGLYSWCFWPLTDPRLLVVFTGVVNSGQAPSDIATIKLCVVAGGLLCVGFCLALRYRIGHPAMWLALGWLAMISLPYADTILHNRSAEVRMFALIMPPLLLGSTLGWASLMLRPTAIRASTLVLASLFVCVVALIAVSQAESYEWLRQLPGAWRLQYVKAYLSPRRYERISYPVGDLAKISQYVYGNRQPVVLVLAGGREEYFNVIGYFAPSLNASANGVGAPSGECGARTLNPNIDKVMFCILPPTADTVARLTGNVRFLQLIKIDDAAAFEKLSRDKVVFKTPSVALLVWDPAAGPGMGTRGSS